MGLYATGYPLCLLPTDPLRPLLRARELANPYALLTCWEYGSANCALDFDAVEY